MAQLMLWLPDMTIAIELIAVLGLLVALAARLRPWQDRARDRRDA